MAFEDELLDLKYMSEKFNLIPEPQLFAAKMVYNKKVNPGVDDIILPYLTGHKNIAELVPYEAEGETVSLPTPEIRRIHEIFLSKPQTILDPKQLRKKITPGTNPIDTGGRTPNAVEAYILDQWTELKNQCATRHEWLRWQAFTGQLTYTNPKGNWSVNYNLPGTHATAHDWTNIAADIYADIQADAQLISDDCGEAPNLLLLGSTCCDNLMNTTKFQTVQTWPKAVYDTGSQWNIQGINPAMGCQLVAKGWQGMDVYRMTGTWWNGATFSPYLDPMFYVMLANQNPRRPFIEFWCPVYDRIDGRDVWYTGDYNPYTFSTKKSHPNIEGIQVLSCMFPYPADMNTIVCCDTNAA